MRNWMTRQLRDEHLPGHNVAPNVIGVYTAHSEDFPRLVSCGLLKYSGVLSLNEVRAYRLVAGPLQWFLTRTSVITINAIELAELKANGKLRYNTTGLVQLLLETP